MQPGGEKLLRLEFSISHIHMIYQPNVEKRYKILLNSLPTHRRVKGDSCHEPPNLSVAAAAIFPV